MHGNLRTPGQVERSDDPTDLVAALAHRLRTPPLPPYPSSLTSAMTSDESDESPDTRPDVVVHAPLPSTLACWCWLGSEQREEKRGRSMHHHPQVVQSDRALVFVFAPHHKLSTMSSNSTDDKKHEHHQQQQERARTRTRWLATPRRLPALHFDVLPPILPLPRSPLHTPNDMASLRGIDDYHHELHHEPMDLDMEYEVQRPGPSSRMASSTR